jgi:tryptophan synthase alpha chain
MNKIELQIKKISDEKRIGLMTHLIVGYPSIEATERLIKTMADAGVDFIELQIPFSDPLADGPTIMKACESSIARGTRTQDAMSIMKKMSREVGIPLIFMSYYNTVFSYGTERFCRDAMLAGAAGVIVPDMPIEEERAEGLFKYAKRYGLSDIRVISRVSTSRRLALNAAVARGFVYCTARQGITGTHAALDPKLIAFLKKARRRFSVPIAVGFGISKRTHIAMIAPYADIVVIGSAIIEVINKSNSADMQRNVGKFIKSLRG